MIRESAKFCPFQTSTYEKDKNIYTKRIPCSPDCKLFVKNQCAIVILANRQLYREFSD